jgi:hypothetical protein
MPQLSTGETLYFKILVPNNIIGSIIGKGGSCVNGMMVITGSKIRVSQNHEFFPETDDRVIVISGASENVHLAIYEVITKYCEVLSTLPLSPLTSTAWIPPISITPPSSSLPCLDPFPLASTHSLPSIILPHTPPPLRPVSSATPRPVIKTRTHNSLTQLPWWIHQGTENSKSERRSPSVPRALSSGAAERTSASSPTEPARRSS